MKQTEINQIIDKPVEVLRKLDVKAFLKMIRDKADEWRAKLDA